VLVQWARVVIDIWCATGGPGGSGVWLVMSAGQLLSATRLGVHYDLIGFDPRGAYVALQNGTIPSLSSTGIGKTM
jgi:hypothetical protein